MQYIETILQNIEADKGVKTKQDVLQRLKLLGLTDFCKIHWALPDVDFPKISGLLPKMAALDIQKKWTGQTGDHSIAATVNFVRATVANYALHTGASIQGKKILDFGCGYGRFLRAYSYYSNQVFGVDPLETSLEYCEAAGLGKYVSKSDPYLSDLKFETQFDFTFAFSVFTHLNEEVATNAMNALINATAQGGMICVTIRPIEIWAHHFSRKNLKFQHSIKHYHKAHQDQLFAFAGRAGSNDGLGDFYGTASINLNWFHKFAEDIELVNLDRTIEDKLQLYAFFKKL